MKVIWTSLTLVEIKLHILSTKWKILMLQTSPINVKNITNNMPIIGEGKTNTCRVDCYNRAENVKMC
jgi:hypothetical protein